jgi:biopolymer transport protein ExbD
MHATTAIAVRAEPNVTPMIDVMLVLLIIFMVITPMLLDGFRAVPPDATNAKAHPESPAEHVLGIDADGHYFLDRRSIPISLLSQRLGVLFAQSDDRVLFIRADRDVAYGQVQDVIARAAVSGVRVVGMITERNQDGRVAHR